MSAFMNSLILSLDKDIVGMIDSEGLPKETAMLLQMLRIMRGRPFKIELNGPGDTTKVWSPDGVYWYPGTSSSFTTGGGPVPPEVK